ncbi:MAG: Thiazole tautomerase [Candidatus Dichloromethanomonas elyunquensis]|nr:MAG: Thiazole tautomerase [Candidatus Dichloromethanomonas elyunquensis]
MLICVTNRKICRDNFTQRIDQIAKGKPYAIILREKDLTISEYENLAKEINNICLENQVPLIIHQNIETAAKLELSFIHLSMPDLRKYKSDIKLFSEIGTSVHSVHEAREAQELGASYVIAGHIFPTDCKKGVPPRGLSFLKDICDSVSVPVFAIGGITKDRVQGVTEAGAKGFCVMSEAMACAKPIEFVQAYRVF